MADIQVDPSVFASLQGFVQPRSLVWVNSGLGFVFYLNDLQDFSYRATADAGETWGDEIVIDGGTFQKFGVWYDGWTRGITGSIIHLCSLKSDDDDIIYRTLNITGSVLGAGQVAFAGTSADIGGTWNDNCLQIR